MFSRHYVGRDLFNAANYGPRQPVSRITLFVDDDNVFTAGDDTGMELTAKCPYATESMAKSLLSIAKGVQYTAYEATAANLDPAAELGDGVTLDGIYSVLAQISDNGDGYPDISFPGEDLIEEEYPGIETPEENFGRKIATTRSLISKTAEEIRLEVAGVEDEISYIQLDLDSITSRVQDTEGNIATLELTATSLRSEISGKIDGDYAQTLIDQTLEGIELSVSSANGSTTFKLTADGAELSSKTLNLSVAAVNITGKLTLDQMASISFGNLTDSATVLNQINTANNTASSALSVANSASSAAQTAANKVSAWAYNGGTYIDSSKIMVTTLMATELLGGEVALLTSAERQAGGLDITGSSSSTYAIELWSNGALRLVAEDGDLYMEAGGEYITIGYVKGEGYPIVVSNTLMPATDGNINLGNYTYYWANAYIEQCYGSAEAASTSDRNKKNSISYDLDRYDPFFDGLQPCIFKLNNGTSGRYHTGLVAQDVEQTLAECGISTTDFAGFIKMEDSYALRYGEFIALLIWQVQKLKARVKELEVRL